MMSIDDMETLLNDIAESLPPALFHELNGGIVLLPDVKLNPHGRHQDLFILGEYHVHPLFGRMISIYYGSMIQIYGHLPAELLKDRLTATLKHEFRHHLESLAGERGLEIEDEEFIRAYLRRVQG